MVSLRIPTPTTGSTTGRLRPLLLTFVLLMVGAQLGYGQLNRIYYYAKCERHINRGEYTQAISTITRFIDFLPDDAPARNLRALAKYQLGDLRGAIVDLDETLRLHPFNFHARLMRAASLDQLGRPKEALADAEMALSLRPAERDARYFHGVTRFLLGEYKKASEEFEWVVARHPANTDARMNLAAAHIQLRDTAAAIAEYEQVAQIDPYLPHPKLQLARIALEQERFPDAKGYIAEVLRQDSHHADALLLKALIAHEEKDDRLALATLDEVLAQPHRSSLALYNRALILHGRGESRRALSDLQRAASISPFNLFIQLASAGIALEMGDPSRALRPLERALEILPENAQTYRMLAETHYKLGNRAQAQHMLDSAERLTKAYKAGTIVAPSDSLPATRRLFAFQNEFSSSPDLILPMQEGGNELLPMASVMLAPQPSASGWEAVARGNEAAGGPFFAVAIGGGDSTNAQAAARLSHVPTGHAARLVEAILLAERHLYDSAIRIVSTIPEGTALAPLAALFSSVCSLQSARLRPLTSATLTLPGVRAPAAARPSYAEPIGILKRLWKESRDPYIAYTLATAHYLDRDLRAADEMLTAAVEAKEGGFAEALYNRGLIRLLMQRGDEACHDLSVAGQAGIDQAYIAIKQHCN